MLVLGTISRSSPLSLLFKWVRNLVSGDKKKKYLIKESQGKHFGTYKGGSNRQTKNYVKRIFRIFNPCVIKAIIF